MNADKQLAWVLLGSFAACGILCFACAVTTRTQYGIQLDRCIDDAKSRAEADACLAKVRLAWDEAGAKPALVTDGGDAQ